MKYSLILLLVFSSSVWAASSQQKLYQAAESGDIGGVRKALKSGADVDKQDRDGWTALLFAATNNQPSVVQLLVSAGADPNIAGNQGETPLIAAVLAQDAPLVKLLLDAGADASAALEDGRGALDLARKRGNQDIVRLLEKGAPAAVAENPDPQQQGQGATSPTEQKNPAVTIEDMRRLIPEWARQDITDKTLEYMKHVAETWPLGKGSEALVEVSITAGAAKGSTHSERIVSTPVLPGIFRQEVTHTDALHGNVNMRFLLVGYGLTPFSTHSNYLGQTITNVLLYEGDLFPLRVGNSEKLSTISSSKMEIKGDSQDTKTTCSSTLTVIDQFDGASITDFPIPLDGRIFAIATDSSCHYENLTTEYKIDNKKVEMLYYSDKLKSFVPLQRPEDTRLTKYQLVRKTLSYKVIN